MRKLVVEEWISLDGYVSDKENKLDFFVQYVRESYNNASRLDYLQSIGTIVLGRKTYDQFAAIWPTRPVEGDPLAGKINTTQKIVFSHTISEAPWGKWQEAEIEKGNLIESIRQLKSEQGATIVVWGSIEIVQLLVKEKLVDEYHFHICPTFTGGGRKFFTGQFPPSALTLIDANYYSSAIVHVCYQQNLFTT